MTKVPDEYDIREQDIEIMLKYLRVNDPENATRKQAEEYLIDLRLSIHGYAHENPEKLEEL